jgi:hypothetical protein
METVRSYEISNETLPHYTASHPGCCYSSICQDVKKPNDGCRIDKLRKRLRKDYEGESCNLRHGGKKQNNIELASAARKAGTERTVELRDK